MTSWFEKFHWRANPFKIQPDPDHIVGFVDMRAKILSYVHSHDPFMIVGPTGAGKTTLLLWTKKQKDAKFIYHNFIVNDPKKLMKKIRGGLFSFLDKRDTVALLDEAQEMDEITAKWLRAAFDTGRLKSMVLATMTSDISDLKDPLMNRIGSRIIKIRNMDQNEAEQLVRQRIFSYGKHNPFDDEALSVIVKNSSSPRNLLENCENMCIAASEADLDYINSRFVKENLREPLNQESIKSKIMSSTSSVANAVRDRLTSGKNDIKSEIEAEFNKLKRTPETPKPQPIVKKPSNVVQKLDNQQENGLSPAQISILKTLKYNDMSAMDIAEAIGGNRPGVAKQLSRLALNTDTQMMENKGIKKPLVETKGSGRPVVYGLTTEGRKFINVA